MEFTRKIDLASERLGGAAIWASDDFFAPKENLLHSGRGEFIPGKYTERGKWMDGWESRRRRDSGHDSVLIRLGLRGRIHGFDVDTNHFLGNAPKSCRVEACSVDGYWPVARLLGSDVAWTEILPHSPLNPGSQHLLPVSSTHVDAAWTHIQLHIYPDGGVARLRVYGDVLPDWRELLEEHRVLDLASVAHGGVVVASNDEFFSDRRNLILPGPSLNM